MRIAWFSPLSPVRSGIANYSEELLPYLLQNANIDVYTDDYDVNWCLEGVNIYRYRFFESKYKYVGYDMIIYHVGNNPYHHYMFPFIFAYPGIVVLHDTVIHNSYAGLTLGSGESEPYVEEMSYNYGEMGRRLALARLREIFTGIEEFMFPLNRRIIESSLGVIVHSNYQRLEIEESQRGLPIVTVPMGVCCAEENYPGKRELKKELGIGVDTFVVGVFGFLVPMKRPELVLKAFRRFLTKNQNSLLLFIGEAAPQYDVGGMIDEAGVKDNVCITGYVSNDEYRRYMEMVDVGVSLRYPTAGETSAAVMRLLGMGKPVIVFNYRQFAELPDSCCPKVNPGDNEEEELAGWLVKLARDQEYLAAMGNCALDYIRNHHTFEKVARAYMDFVDKVRGVTGTGAKKDLRRMVETITEEWSNLKVATSVRCTLIDVLMDTIGWP